MRIARFACTLLAAALGGCSDSGSRTPDGGGDSFDRNGLLAHLGNNLLLPAQADFAARSAALVPALTAHCDALDAGNGTDAGTLVTARASLGATLDSWQRADAMLVGPAAMDDKALRGLIYGWPLLSACELDRDVATRWTTPASYDLDARLINARSLSAVEYLLYPQTSMHACVSTPPGWDALGADLPRARCRLALALATDVAAKAAQLHAAWRPDGGNYVGQLAAAGTSGSSLPSAQGAVNLLSDAMFYVDRMVKDMKLAEAAGIALNACETVQAPCIREVELRFADRSTFAIRANLGALRELFTGTIGGPVGGTPGPGFDDFLTAVGHPDIALRMTTNLDAAIAQAAALPDSFLTALDQDYAKVVSTHAAVRGFTDDLKSQFLTVLSLEIPDDVAADND